VRDESSNSMAGRVVITSCMVLWFFCETFGGRKKLTSKWGPSFVLKELVTKQVFVLSVFLLQSFEKFRMRSKKHENTRCSFTEEI
jgi:hypothetical protein